MTKSRFDGTRCEFCRGLLEFHQPPDVTVSSGEPVDVMHSLPWCERWRNPLRRERCIPVEVLRECQKESP